ncbi:MAG: hypothetical protein IPK12_19385 [Gemmatimonadetes bacterium]|nr:hypothetical protein [Gemmatimonadota bacterium]
MEIDGRPQLPASCTRGQEGGWWCAPTPRLTATTATCVELGFAEGNHVCAVCVSSGHCELQDLATELGIDHVRVPIWAPGKSGRPPAPRASRSTSTAASSAGAACASAMRSRGRIPGMSPTAASPAPDRRWARTGVGFRWRAAPAAASAWQVCPTGALFAKGSGVSR